MTTVTTTTATQTAPAGDPALEYGVKKGLEAFGEGFKKVFDFTQSFSLIEGGLVRSGAGALAAVAFTAVAPWAGAAYGLTYTLASRLVNRIDEKFEWPDNALMSVIKYALPKIAGIGAGLAAVALAGFALSSGTVAALVGGTILFSVVGFAAIGTVKAGIGCLVGCSEGYRAYQDARASYTSTTHA